MEPKNLVKFYKKNSQKILLSYSASWKFFFNSPDLLRHFRKQIIKIAAVEQTFF